MNVILVRPKYDDVTRTLNGWAGKASGHISVSDDLNGDTAVEKKLRNSLLKNRSTELIAFYGHGKPNFLIGQPIASSGPSVINTNSPGVLPTELTGRNVYAVACHAGAGLGPKLSAAGCNFIGYNLQFAYTDGFENDFKRIVNHGLVSWAQEEKTTAEVVVQLKEEWSALRTELSIGSRKTVENAFLAALSANWNHQCVCYYESHSVDESRTGTLG